MDNLVELYCHIDDFCKAYTAEQQQKMLKLKNNSSKKPRNKPCKISLAEIITILVLFHQIRYREFKAFYYGYVCQWLKNAFPRLPSYNRMVELMEKAVYPMCGICQHSCHPYLNQATKTPVGITRLDGRTGLRAVGSTGEQFLTALPFQRAGFACFAITSTDSRLARISPSLSV